eukprot:919039-Rhodomonas_salina.3
MRRASPGCEQMSEITHSELPAGSVAARRSRSGLSLKSCAGWILNLRAKDATVSSFESVVRGPSTSSLSSRSTISRRSNGFLIARFADQSCSQSVL